VDISEIQQNFHDFLRLLEFNNDTLRVISDLEEKSGGEYLFDMEFIKTSLGQLDQYVGEIVDLLNSIGRDRYGALRDAYDRIRKKTHNILPGEAEIPADNGVIPFADLDSSFARQVGSKCANLGELKNHLGLSVPDGFSITAYGYRMFMEHNRLPERIQAKIDELDLRDFNMLLRTSQEIQELIRSSDIPPELEEKVEAAIGRLSGENGDESYSVRSSALGEDTQFSFAGQYASFLNVPSTRVLDSYRRVMASQFTPGAMYYFLCQGMRENEVAMSVAGMRMIEGRTAGVMYTVNPVDPENRVLIINSVWGLGKYVVDGTITPDTFLVDKENSKVVEENIAEKSIQLVFDDQGGVSSAEVASDMRSKPSLERDHIKELSDYAIKIENHYGEPQDIEWVIDREGIIYFLQSRPLRVYQKPKRDTELDVSVYPVLFRGGVTAASGVGGGRVFHLRQVEDLQHCPDGAVIVAHTPFAALTAVMSRVNAIITEVGGITGHMATVAREFRIPTLMNVKNGLNLIPNASKVTLDADNAVIYEGVIEQLISERSPEENIFEDTALFVTLERMLNNIVPLNLVSPHAPDFTPDHCRTYHDITRFAHQKALDEVFHFAGDRKAEISFAPKLKTDIPLTINILAVDAKNAHLNAKKELKEEELPSQPMKAFWDGVTAVGWPHPPAVSAKGFASVLATSVSSGAETRPSFSENSFALLSEEYMNFSIRMGYHYSTVESMCTDVPNKNFIRLRFQEGGAAIDRRKRRIRLMVNILKELGFENRSKGDFLDARLTHCEKDELLFKLKRLGALSIHTKQLDMALSSDNVALWYQKEIQKKLKEL
jgi:pyruvate,water dikinase